MEGAIIVLRHIAHVGLGYIRRVSGGVLMLLNCSSCKFMFEKDKVVAQCPDCGKYSVREASPDEIREYEERKLIKDDWFEQSPPSLVQLMQDVK